MSELKEKLGQLSTGRGASETNTLVSVDRSNVKRWKIGLYGNDKPIDEISLIKGLLEAPRVKEVKIYSSNPGFDENRLQALEKWLAENSPADWRRIRNTTLSRDDYWKSLGEAILSAEPRIAIHRKIRGRVQSLLSQANDSITLSKLKEMGATLFLKEPKVYYNALSRDREFGPLVSSLVGQMETVQNEVRREERVLQAGLRGEIDRMAADLASVQGIAENCLEDSVWARTYAEIERHLLEVSKQLLDTKLQLDEMSVLMGGMDSTMNYVKSVMVGEPVLINKCNLDVEMVVGTLDSKVINDHQNFVFLSGDGDFADLYRKLSDTGKRVMVVAPFSKLGKEVKVLSRQGNLEIFDPAEDASLWKKNL